MLFNPSAVLGEDTRLGGAIIFPVVYPFIIVVGLWEPERQQLWAAGAVVQGVEKGQNGSDNVRLTLRWVNPKLDGQGWLDWYQLMLQI